MIEEIKDWITSILFRFKRIPNYSEYSTIPKGTRYFFNANNIKLGNLEWKDKEWVKLYTYGKDPDFRYNLPYDQDISVREDITFDGEEIILTRKPGSDSKTPYLYSNIKIKYGTVRALIKMPKTPGAWSAFWLYGDNGMPEHDIVEHCGGKDYINVTQHWGYDYKGPRGKKSTLHNTRKNKGIKATDEYYLYEIELGPYKTIYRINGVVTRVMKKHLSSSDHHIIFGTGMGDYCGNIIPNKDSIMRIKYIEIFKIK